MRPELYPDDWPAISRAIREACDWQCQQCGRQCTRPGEPYTGARNVLTVAHASPTGYEEEAATLWGLCAVCHLRWDSRWGMFFRRKHARRRQHEAGQLPLWKGTQGVPDDD